MGVGAWAAINAVMDFFTMVMRLFYKDDAAGGSSNNCTKMCEKQYQQGFTYGNKTGWIEGYLVRKNTENCKMQYQQGFEFGQTTGWNQGYLNRSNTEKCETQFQQGFTSGNTAGWIKGYLVRNEMGETAGLATAFLCGVAVTLVIMLIWQHHQRRKIRAF